MSWVPFLPLPPAGLILRADPPPQWARHPPGWRRMPRARMGAEPSPAEGSWVSSRQEKAADTSRAAHHRADRLRGEDNSFLTTSIRR